MDSERTPDTRLRVALAAADKPIVVDTSEKLEQAAAEWANHALIGVDTEFLRERTYRAALGLMQLSDGETAWLVDPLALENLTPLRTFLENPEHEKVIHSGSEDFEVIHHQLGVQPAGALDSQIACALLGQSLQLGYHHAVNWLLDVEIEKDHTRSNWLRRPLSRGQLRYAALDVVLLPAMMERLRAELERLGRWSWMQEEVSRMQRKSTEDANPAHAWKRIGGAGSLSDKERSVLRALAGWRERIAAQKDTARGFIVPDAVLIVMARAMPSSHTALEQIDELHTKSIQRYGSVWLDLVAEAKSAVPPDPLFQLSTLHRKWLAAMRRTVAQAAAELKVDAALLASRKQLERLIARHVHSRDIPGRFKGWRYPVITEDLLKIMRR